MELRDGDPGFEPDRKHSAASVEDWSREWRKFQRSLMTMDITRLPSYILEELISYLRGSDLAACSAVCFLWREAFNDDFYWRRLCYQDVVGYLRNVVCAVKPHYAEPPYECQDSLEEVCDWRVNFSRQAHLLRNWQNSRYTIQTIYTYDSNIIHSGHVLHDTGEHWLILSTRSKTQVWNIQDVPYMEAAVMNYCESFVAGVGGLLLRAGHNLLEVFRPDDLLAPRNSPKCDIKLAFACLIDNQEAFPGSVETTSDVTNAIARSPDYDFRNPFDYFIIGNLFVGYQPSPSRGDGRPRIHFWDLFAGVKVHEDAAPRACTSCALLKGDTARPLVLVYVYQSSTFITRNLKVSQIYLYDVDAKAYTGFYANVPAKVIWWGMGKEVLVARQERAFHLFNVNDGTCVHVKGMDLKMGSSDCDLAQSQFMEGSRLYYSSRYHLHVMDVDAQEMIYSVDMDFVIFSLHSVRNRFVVVSSKSGSEVWDLEERRLVLKLPFLFTTDFKIDSDAAPVRLLARSQNEVCVINFW